MKSRKLPSGLLVSVLVVLVVFLGTTMIMVTAQDTELPKIYSEPIAQGWVGQPILVSANVTDNVAVNQVHLNYTNVSGVEFNESMTLTGNNYTYTIPAPSVAGSIEYFIWANDTSNNENRTANSTITISVDTFAPDIYHTPVTQGWVNNTIAISATVTDNVAVNQVHLNYTNVSGVEFNESMTLAGGMYTFAIPPQSTVGSIEYFIWANDTNGNVNKTDNSTITISYDTERPAIVHTPITSVNTGEQFNISAEVTDNAAVNVVCVNYTDVGGVNHNETMSLVTGNTYNYTIPAQSSAGSMTYFIWANDKSGNENRTASYTITIVAADTEPPTIVHSPVTSATAGEDITIEATITDNVAVQSASLYYRKKGEPTYQSKAMTKSGDTYSAAIPSSVVTTAGVEYYITATDGVNPARSPATGSYEIGVTEKAGISWLWIIVIIVIIIIIIAIVAAIAARKKPPEVPEEVPPEEEEPSEELGEEP